MRAHIQADLDFHEALADASGNPLFAMVLAPIGQILMDYRRKTIAHQGAGTAFECHAKILGAVITRAPAEAARAMREHIEASTGHLLALVTRAGQTPAPRPRRRKPTPRPPA